MHLCQFGVSGYHYILLFNGWPLSRTLLCFYFYTLINWFNFFTTHLHTMTSSPFGYRIARRDSDIPVDILGWACQIGIRFEIDLYDCSDFSVVSKDRFGNFLNLHITMQCQSLCNEAKVVTLEYFAQRKWPTFVQNHQTLRDNMFSCANGFCTMKKWLCPTKCGRKPRVSPFLPPDKCAIKHFPQKC